MKWNGIPVLGFLLFSSPALSHMRLNYPSPRVMTDAIKDGAGDPCGSTVRMASPLIVPPNSSLQVSWFETVDHPGHYIIRFSQANDSNWTVLLDNIPDIGGAIPSGGRLYSRTVTLPSQTCSACTLQVVQVMTDRNPPSNYYSCTDLVIATGAPPPPPPTQSDSSTPPGNEFSAFGCGKKATSENTTNSNSNDMLLFLGMQLLAWCVHRVRKG